MDFSELVDELQARGFSDLTDARAGVYINNARAELDRMYLWPWRETSITGTAPISIADLAVIEAVTNETLDYRLPAVQFRDALDMWGDLSITGTPSVYYTASPLGVPAVATYPTGTDTIGVQYWKVTVDLTGTQDPASPSEAHYLIVDMAVQRAYRDKHNHEAANALQAEIDRQLDALLFQYSPGVADDSGHIIGGWNSIDW